MPTTTAADGTRIAYQVEGAGPPLVLLHGITEDRRRFAPVVERLAGEFACVGVDARGHGESSRAGSDYELTTMAADVAAVVEATDAEGPPLIVGHSLGAMVGTAYAAAAPVRGVVNIDQSLRMSDLAAVVRSLEPQLRGPGFPDAMDAVAEGLGVAALPAPVGDAIRTQGRAAPPDVVLAIWAPLLEHTDAELMSRIETELLAAVRVPYLALHGSEPGDDYRSWLTRLVPTATVEVWDGHGHWLHLVDPDRFAARVREFAAEI